MPSAPSVRGMSARIAVALVLFQFACPIIIAAQDAKFSAAPGSSVAKTSDAARYRAIAGRPGRPYKDFDVEYPPVALGVFKAMGPSTYTGFRRHLLALEIACQALVVFLLFRFWSRRAGWSYLLLSAPMLFVVYSTYDLVAVALAVAAATLVRERHPTAGAVGFVLGAFTKVWPVVLLPGVLVARHVRAFWVAVATGIAGLAAWTVWGGTGAVGQVVSYRGARGWQFESLPGSTLRLLTRDQLRFETGSWRLGAPPRALSLLLGLALVGVVAWIWWTAWQRPDVPAGVPETAAITAVLVFGTLLSPQFLIWVLPFAAIAAAGGARRIERWALGVSVLTLLDRIVFDPGSPGLLRTELVVLGRNATLVGLLVVAVAELRTVVPSREPEPIAA